MVKSVVFDSSPWIFLAKIGVIDSALDLFHPIYIPSSVNKEILGKKDECASVLEKHQTEEHIIILEAKNRRLLHALGNRLGKGEAEAITIAIEREVSVICLDDYPARIEATRLGLEIKGTLGIIRRLMEIGMFQCDLGELFEDLKKINFRVKNHIFWEIFRDINQKV